MAKIQRNCPVCNSSFEVSDTPSRIGRGKYCSKDCTNIAQTCEYQYGPEQKRCYSCGAIKILNEFAIDQSTASGRKASCKLCSTAKSTEWNQAHPERYKENRINWAKANSERLRELGRESYRRNPAPKINQAHLRRAAIRIADSETVEYITILRHDPCAYCGGPMKDIDHIVPFKSDGTHNCENLTAACESCNSRKGSKNLLEFLGVLNG